MGPITCYQGARCLRHLCRFRNALLSSLLNQHSYIECYIDVQAVNPALTIEVNTTRGARLESYLRYIDSAVELTIEKSVCELGVRQTSRRSWSFAKRIYYYSEINSAGCRGCGGLVVC